MSTEMQAADGEMPRVLKGIGFGALGYGLFSAQDATVKYLVTAYSVPEILFVRSLVILVIAVGIGGPGQVAALRHSRAAPALLGRAALILVAWLSYYAAAPSLPLAELTTLYFAAPVISVALSAMWLRETVDAPRWAAVTAGFVGVVLAADPTRAVSLGPAGLALFAACCWGVSVVLARVITRTESTAVQMLVSNGVFALACGLMLAVMRNWVMPDLFALGLMVGLGITSGLGQFFLFEGYRYAPASVLAPVEYTGLVWAFVFGHLIWSEKPGLNVYAGAGLIVAGSLTLVWFERRRALRSVAAIDRRGPA